jgi:hypothetical protein
MLIAFAGVAAALSWAHPLRAGDPQEGTAAKTEVKRINDWIGQLGSSEFQERERATKNLMAAGPLALEYVQKAAGNQDAEIRRRAGLVSSKIEKDIDTDRLLKPKRIHLVYRDTPLTEAVADFAKKSGYPIQFEGDRVRLSTRKITLDTGEVTFWEALDQFCRTGGLMDRRGHSPANAGTSPINQRDRMALAEIRMAQRRGMVMPPARVDFGRIVLVEGRESLPTSQSGGLRLRILRPKTQIPGHANSSQEAVLALEVSPEPGIDWRGVIEAHVDRASDLQNRDLKQIQESMEPTNTSVNELAWGGMAFAGNNVWVANNNAWFVNGGDIETMVTSTDPPVREFPIRLKLNDRDSKGIREIRGVLFAQVQSPIEPILRADKILESEGKSIRGPENSLLKINEARRRDNGQYDFRVTVRPPSMGEDMTGMFQGAVFVRRFNGRMAIMAQQEGESPTAQKLALQDAKGRSFQLVTSEESTQVNGIDITQELHLVYQSKPGMDEPAQLIYSGQRLVSIEVPFLFKNVPLSE